MTVGLHTVNMANVWLDQIPTTVYFQQHIGDPGAAGTANQSAVTTRSAGTYAAASGGSKALTGTKPSFTETATETISHVSAWSASSGGNVLFTAALTTSKNVVNTDVFTLNTCTVSIPSSARMA